MAVWAGVRVSPSLFPPCLVCTLHREEGPYEDGNVHLCTHAWHTTGTNTRLGRGGGRSTPSLGAGLPFWKAPENCSLSSYLHSMYFVFHATYPTLRFNPTTKAKDHSRQKNFSFNFLQRETNLSVCLWKSLCIFYFNTGVLDLERLEKMTSSSPFPFGARNGWCVTLQLERDISPKGRLGSTMLSWGLYTPWSWVSDLPITNLAPAWLKQMQIASERGFLIKRTSEWNMTKNPPKQK